VIVRTALVVAATFCSGCVFFAMESRSVTRLHATRSILRARQQQHRDERDDDCAHHPAHGPPMR